jgi:alcohol dehydrogenase class IV
MFTDGPYIANLKPFMFKTPGDITFGAGSSGALLEKVNELGAKKPLFITGATMGKNARLLTLMDTLKDGGLEPSGWHEVKPEPPEEHLKEALAFAQEKQSDCIIAFGGGSSMDFAKILSVMIKYPDVPVSDFVGVEKIPGRGVPTVMMPTTAGSGSEVTTVSVLSFQNPHTKKNIRSRRLMADVALIDPALTLPLPPSTTAVSGMDAFIHAAESYISNNANPLSRELAIAAIKHITANLPQCVRDGSDLEAREKQSYGSLLAGLAFAMTGTAAVHALSYPFGVRYGLSHGEACSILLCGVMKYNALDRADRLADIAEAMGVKIDGMSDKEAAEAAIEAMADLAAEIGLKSKARETGRARENAEDMAKSVMKETFLLDNNPHKLTPEEMKKIYDEAWQG